MTALEEQQDKKSGAMHTLDAAVALGVVGILIVLLVPIPSFLMDILLSFNISLAILTLLTILHTKRALEMSTFPTILLLVTLLRLALNVASTRLILLKADAGSVIFSFGDFVVGGNLLVGVVIFLILVIIQFVVITKGATRVSEVAARFTLDAMPGKQMAIDADLNAGLISESDARERRESVQQEAEFYGAMDGASKFIRGEAIAGLIITAINVLGGMGVGVSQGDTILEALRRYAILTIGDGLVTQIPALFISTAAGILVTKASSKSYLPRELTMQFLRRPKAVGLSGVMILLLGLTPGLPKVPFFVLAIVLGGIFFAINKRDKDASKAEEEKEDAEGAEGDADEIDQLLLVDRLGIELGYKLVSLVKPEAGGGLLDHITNLRKQLVIEKGFVIPPIRVRDNLQIDSCHYRILLGGEEIAQGDVLPEYLLALGPQDAGQELNGIPAVEPTFGLPALWITPDRRSQAELANFTVVEPVSVLVTHLTEVIRSRSHEILTRDDVQTLLDSVKEHSPVVVNELVPGALPLGEVQKVFQNLLREGVGIRNLPLILETIADNVGKSKDPDILTELVRHRLSHSICRTHQDETGSLSVITLAPELENKLVNYTKKNGQIGADGLNPTFVQTLLGQVSDLFKNALHRGKEPVLLVRGTIRRLLSDVVYGVIPKAAVVSYNEVATAKNIEPLGTIDATYVD